jgi:hypothetical protein
MAPLLEPSPGTLEALEDEFSRRLAPHLRAIVRESKRSLFDDSESNSLVELAGRIVELHTKLKVEETKAYLVATKCLLAYLQSMHGENSNETGA